MKLMLICIDALLYSRATSFARGITLAEKSIDDYTRVQQVGRSAQDLRERRSPSGRLGLRSIFFEPEVGPLRWNQGARSVGKDQEQMQPISAVRPAKDVQRLSLERVSLPCDSHFLWITVEVGSVSYGPLIGSTMIS